ncbi:MAG TPA: homoserine dehydrogenase [Pseudomonadales bacterium]|nr:homoserine dehydrogenase [Pseudomonadales bacterium]
MKKVTVGLCGLGTVGSGVFNVMTRNAALINARAGCDVSIVHVGARRDREGCDTSDVTLSRDIFAVLEDPAVDIVVELIGGTDAARDLVLKAIENGKHVVTANKALIAHHGAEIFAAAAKKQVAEAYEAAVAGGIPIIKALRDGLVANRIEWVAGIINGTTNFILTEMSQKGSAFADVLKEAQRLGYAEADPTFDVEGIDAAHKLVILASIAFGMPLEIKKIYTEGITTITQEDIRYAAELGYCIKHLGIARESEAGVELRVNPTLVPNDSLLAKVDGAKNAVMVMGDAVGPTLYSGAGAGSEPTASAVIADIVDVARAVSHDKTKYEHHLPVPYMGFVSSAIKAREILPITQIHSAYYLRLVVADKPGVMSAVTQLLSNAGVSIEAIIQKEPQRGSAQVSIVLITNVVQESSIDSVIEDLAQKDFVVAPAIKLRVEALGT